MNMQEIKRNKKGNDMLGQSLNYHTYRILTEQNLIEWVQNCLSGVSDEVIIPQYITEDIKNLSNSIAEFICTEKYKHKQTGSNLAESEDL